MTDEDLRVRLQRAEAALAHLEHQYDQLNSVIVEQGRVLDRYRRQLEVLSETVQAQELDRIRSTPTKPPHYSA